MSNRARSSPVHWASRFRAPCHFLRLRHPQARAQLDSVEVSRNQDTEQVHNLHEKVRRTQTTIKEHEHKTKSAAQVPVGVSRVCRLSGHGAIDLILDVVRAQAIKKLDDRKSSLERERADLIKVRLSRRGDVAVPSIRVSHS